MSKLTKKPLTKEQIKAKLSMFIYGPTRSGKTYLASTLLDDPELLPAIVLSCDNSELTLRDFICPDLDVYHADLSFIEEVYEHVTSKDNKYKTVFLDNLSSLHRSCLEKEAAKASVGKSRTEYNYTPGDYGVARAQILTILDMFSKIPHIVFIVTNWSITDIAEGTGKKSIDINIAGKLQGEVGGFTDLLGYLHKKEYTANEVKQAEVKGITLPDVRILQVSSTSDVQAVGIRGKKFIGKEIIDPTIPKIKKLLLGEVSG